MAEEEEAARDASPSSTRGTRRRSRVLQFVQSLTFVGGGGDGDGRRRESHGENAWDGWKGTEEEEEEETLIGVSGLERGAGECSLFCGCFHVAFQTRRRWAAIQMAEQLLERANAELKALRIAGANSADVITLASLSSRRQSEGSIEPPVESVLIYGHSVGNPMSVLPQSYEYGMGLLRRTMDSEKATHWELAKRIASQMRHPDYKLKQFYDDCVVRRQHSCFVQPTPSDAVRCGPSPLIAPRPLPH